MSNAMKHARTIQRDQSQASGDRWDSRRSRARRLAFLRNGRNSRRKQAVSVNDSFLLELTRRLLFAALVLSPWMSAFESAWVQWTVAGIGCLILMIQIVRWQSGHGHSALDETSAANAWVGQAVAGVILFLLSWCLISAMNACGRVDPVLTRWVPLPHFVSWLPHSFDGNATWKTFFYGLALAGFFWGTRNWFFEYSLQEWASKHGKRRYFQQKRRHSKTVPRCLQELIWVLTINGALLVLVALLQRATDSPLLLAIFKDPLDRGALTHFGPFAYRNNAAQYLGMIWLLPLGLWLFTGSRRRRISVKTKRFGESARIMSLFLGVIILGGGLFVFSRTGWQILIITLVLASGATVSRWFPGKFQWGMVMLAWLTLLAGVVWLAWPHVIKRFQAQFQSLPVNHPEGLEEFTLAGVLDLRYQEDNKQFILGLFPSSQASLGEPQTFAVHLWLKEGGGLSLSAFNAKGEQCCQFRQIDLLESLPGQKLELVIVCHEGLRLFVNGRLMAYIEPSESNQPAWIQRFPGSYVKNFSYYSAGGVRYMGFDRVMLWNEVVAPRRVSSWITSSGPSLSPPLLDFDRRELSWEKLLWLKEDTLLTRGQIWSSALKMAQEARWPRIWGGGPGTYPGCYAVSPARLPELKELHVHNDYLEFLITFGLPGSLALFVGLGLVLARPFLSGGIRLPFQFVVLLWISLLGCLLFAFVDWPLFAPPVQLLFIVLCAVLSIASIQRKPPSERFLEMQNTNEENIAFV